MKSESVVMRLLAKKELILYGSEDYVERVKTYLQKIKKIKIDELIFPLQAQRPELTKFDWDLHADQLALINKDYPILVTLSMKYHDLIRKQLLNYGFSTMFFYTAEMDNVLKKLYFSHVFSELGHRYMDIYQARPVRDNNQAKVEIYMSKCIVDQPLSKCPPISPFLIPIQSGAILTEQRITEVLDSTGDHISDKNRRYSEMTSAYWAWKNSRADFIGMCHYRRHFVHPEKIAEKLQTTDVEVVLPLPTLYLHSLKKEYFLRYIPDVWETMLDVLEDNYPEYAAEAETIFADCYFYGNNMWILKKCVLDDFFNWMFPMLYEIEERVGELPDPYYNRYIGFCTELLTTLYFLANKKHWKIAHAEKIFIS